MQKRILKTLIIIFSTISILSCIRSQQSTNFVASNKEITWLENNCIKLKTVEAGNGFEDLEPLKKIIGTSRIVGLGEFSHGSSEVFEMKHRLIEFLVTEMGFNIFSIEENMPEAYHINNYILKGEGNSKELLRNCYGIWNTQEMLELVEWMREYNANSKNKIQYMGFDMQIIMPAILNLSLFAEKNDKIFKMNLDSLRIIVENGQSLVESNSENIYELASRINIRSKRIRSYLIENKNSIVKTIQLSEYQWLVQNATLIVQGTSAKKGRKMITRDSCMAENVTWLLNSIPDAKIVVWAHNAHINNKPGRLGGFLSEKYGNGYYNIGFLSNSGTFSAYNAKGTPNIMEDSRPGSFEYSFHKTQIPIFFFEFRKISNDLPLSTWLLKSLNTRFIGSYVEKDSMIIEENLSKAYNAIIYLDSSHASRHLN